MIKQDAREFGKQNGWVGPVAKPRRLSRGLLRNAKGLRKSAHEFRRSHSPLSLQLHFTEQQPLITGRNDDFFVALQNFSRRAANIDNRRGKYLQIARLFRFCRDSCKCAWPWIKRADFSLDDLSWLGPIDFAVLAGQFGCVSAERVVLPNARWISFRKQSQRFEQCFRRDLCQTIVQRTAGIGGQDVSLALQQDIAGIESLSTSRGKICP